MACGTNIVPGFQEANRKVNSPKDESVYNKLMNDSVYEPTANTPQDILEAQRTVRHIQEEGRHPDDALAWRKPREVDAPKRKKDMSQPDSLVFAANQVKNGNMSVQKFRELVQKSDSPVTSMQEVPELVSVTNLARALDAGKAGKGRIIGLPGIEIQEGTRVGLRLDIPAYQNMDTWVNAIHFKEKVEGTRPGNAYSTASAGTNVEFGKHSKKAINVATGTAKSPFAVMDVEWQSQSPEQTHKEITAALEDSKQPESRWKQIGMNPNRSGFFYDKATFLPVSSASRVLQVGALVMAQDVQYVGREGSVNFAPIMGGFFGNKKEKEFDKQLDNELNLDDAIIKFDSKGYKSSLNPKVEAFVDSSGNPFTMPHDHSMKGKYAFMIHKAANKQARNVFKNYGRPNIVQWSRDGGHYNASSDTIALPLNPDTLKNGDKIYNSVVTTALHETWHWADYQLGREIYPEFQDNIPVGFSGADRKFRWAFFKDAENLGITLEENIRSKKGFSVNFYDQDMYKRDSSKIWEQHDDDLSALVFYDQMLSNPSMHNKINNLVKSNPPDSQRSLLANIFRGNESIGMEQMVQGISDENVMHTFGHQFMVMDANVTDEKYIYPPESLLQYIQSGYNDGGIPPLSDIPSMIDELEARLKDSSAMAEMESKRNKLYKEIHDEGVSIGRNLSQLTATMDIIDAMTSGDAFKNGGLSGHGVGYYTESRGGGTDGGYYRRMAETFAQLGTAWSKKDENSWKYIEKYFPSLAKDFQRIINKHGRTKIKSAFGID